MFRYPWYQEFAAFDTLPVAVPSAQQTKKRKTTSGWNSLVQPFREKALFWHEVWKSAGKPLNCELHTVMKRSRNVYHYQVKKVKKSESKIKKDKLLEACMNGNGDLFKELKKIRHHSPQIATSIDGKNDDLANHFKGLYAELYNSVNDDNETFKIRDSISEKVTYTELFEVNKVTPHLVKEATSKLSQNKSDPVYFYSSDCLRNGTDLLYELLSVVFQSFLIHGHFTIFLLLANLIPIVKDKLGSINARKNYRSIAISSLVLKMFDWVVILLYGSALELDDLQFAYQSGCSTTMCTWSVLETILIETVPTYLCVAWI